MNSSVAKARRSRSFLLVETLEGRRLMSGWTTVDTDANSYELTGMAADKAGSVYAVGADNSNNANLRQESGGVWSTALTIADGGVTEFNSVATDSAGDVFIAGSVQGNTSGIATIWERHSGQSGLIVVDSLASAEYKSITTDAAGDVFATGTQTITTTSRGKATTTQYGIVRKLTAANGSFVASTSSLGTSVALTDITVIVTGTATGAYAVGTSSSNYWNVFKSSNGGGSWSLVDQFRYDPGYGSSACAVTGDAAGNIYVGGLGQTAVATGYSRTGKPIYATRNHWIVRKSFGGNSGSWSVNDDYLPSGDSEASPLAMGADLGGSIYVVGYAGTSLNATHAIIRTNAGGSWSPTSDDYAGPAGTAFAYNAFTVDSTGTLYAGGDDMANAVPPTFVRSMPGAAPATILTSSPFSQTAIALNATSNLVADVIGN